MLEGQIQKGGTNPTLLWALYCSSVPNPYSNTYQKLARRYAGWAYPPLTQLTIQEAAKPEVVMGFWTVVNA